MAKIGEIRKKKTAARKPRTPKPAAEKKAEAAPAEPPETPPPPGEPDGPGTSSPPAGPGEAFEALVFRVAENRYAIRLEEVERVEMPEHVTRVPRTPDYVLGVVTVRGEPVPAVDFRRLFGLEPRPWDLSTRLLVVRIAGRRVGFVVDEARSVRRIRGDEVLPPPEMIHGLAGDYLVGIVRRPEETLLVVNLTQVLALADRGGREAVMQMTSAKGGTDG